MRKLLVVLLSLNAILLLGILLHLNQTEAQAEECTSLNGDVDGNGSIELTDAMLILNYAFVGTVEDLVPVCQQEVIQRGPLTATGQTECYNSVGGEIDCTSADYPGQDGFYRTGCPMENRFIDNGDGTVTDSCTGLMWQKDTADISGNGSIGSEDRTAWELALNYCENLDFAGHVDWRLPNVRELQSIVDYGRWYPAMDPVFSSSLSDWYYWSSSSGVNDPGFGWVVGFVYGVVVGFDRGNSYHVRAVRNAR